MWTTITRAIGAAPGRLPRQVGAGVDLARSTGLGYLWQRRAESRAQAGRAHPLAVYRTIWTAAAEEVGATLSDLGSGFFELRRDRARTRVWFNWVELEDIVTHRLSLDKTRVHELLVSEGVPVPDHIEIDFRDLEQAERFLQESGTCVMKPASGTSAGYGVTSGIRSNEDLARARLRASRADRRILVERQAPGSAYRLLVLDGELIDVVRRDPPAVVGDGGSSIRELIAAENRARLEAGGWRGFRQLTVDLEAVLTLGAQDLGLASIPAAGERVTVKHVESQNASHENETIRDGVAKEVGAAAVRASEALGLRLAGIDLVSPDLSQPLDQNGGAIIEVNGTPGFQYHYLVAEPPRATAVAVPVLRTLLSERSR